ncbi:MAG: CHAD domain-containing protein [Bryobacterales bacterium]
MTLRADLPLGAFARVQARERLHEVGEQMRKVRRDQNPDAVHDLRVAIRRFSTTLALFPELFSRKRIAKCDKRLKRLRKAAGEVRDRDIALMLAASGQEAALGLSEARAKAAKALRRALSGKRRKAALAAGKAALKLRKRQQDAVTWREGWRPSESACENAVERLPLLVERLFAAGRDALSEPAPDVSALHRLRLEAKRVRYTLEVFAPCYGPELDDRLEQLKILQDALGDINDCRASRAHATGADMHALLEARQQALAQEFERFWSTVFDAPGECEGWMLELARKSSLRAAAAT